MAEHGSDIQEGGSTKGLLIIGLLVGLAIGGGATFFFVQGQGSDEASHEATEVEEKKASKESLQAVRFDRLTVPISADVGGRSRFIGNFFINIDVMVRGNDNLITVRRSEPQLKHAFIAAINSSNLMQDDAPQQLDLEKTADVLKERGNKVVGSGVIVEINVIEALRLPN